MNTRLFSIVRCWHKCFNFGVGVGWDTADGTFCVLIQFGFWVMRIGPHISKP